MKPTAMFLAAIERFLALLMTSSFSIASQSFWAKIVGKVVSSSIKQTAYGECNIRVLIHLLLMNNNNIRHG